jgi:hypothetical protein
LLAYTVDCQTSAARKSCWGVRPVVDAFRVQGVLALDFLQEHDVRAEQAQLVAQLVEHHAPAEL